MIQQLKEKIEKFQKSHRGLFDIEYDPDLNFYGLKSESFKYSTKEQYIDVCARISIWLDETEKLINTYQLTDIIVLENDVYLYTKRPGWWIGKSGSTLKSLEDTMNTNIDGERIRDYKIHIIEDKDSIFNMISTGYGHYWAIQDDYKFEE